MDLAQALSARADLTKRIAADRERLLDTARYQEGEIPAERSGTILDRIEAGAADLAVLITRINHTNATTVLPNGMTLTAALAHREYLLFRISVLTRLIEAAGGSGRNKYLYRSTRSELAFRTDVDAEVQQSRLAATSKEHRELDDMIQRAGWVTELAEVPSAT